MTTKTAKTVAQRDFSGGEISSRMLMRADLAAYGKSVLQMINFHPTLQGSMVRTPGTRFLYEIANANARLIPYITPDNKRGFLEMTPGLVKIRTGLPEIVGGVLSQTQVNPLATETVIRKNIVPNPRFQTGAEGWDLQPTAYVGGDGARLGTYWGQYPGATDGYVRMSPRIYKDKDIALCTLGTIVTVTEPTDSIDVAFNVLFLSAIPIDSSFNFTLKISAGGGEIFSYAYIGVPGTRWNGIARVNLPTLGFTGDLTVQFSHLATTAAGAISHPRMEVQLLEIFANVKVQLDDSVITGVTPPWSASELKDVHFVQSPYGYPTGRKELVLVHPRHAPHWFYFNGANYILEVVPFTFVPSGWSTNNYPATCASFMGRLILGGSNSVDQSFASLTSNTETVWGTEVGKWSEFSDPLSIETVNPDDSIEFTTIYRSPIQWAYGQKDLLVGAAEMEYVTSADGIFSPGDLGVFMQSTHGSVNVQPAGFGDTVMFAAEGGKKVRAMAASNQDQGFLSPDMTLLVPELCASGIRRMLRMRNPHQMCVVLLNSGVVAMLHYDRLAGITGWSRYDLSAKVQDICVVTNEAGEDILFLTVERFVNGVHRLYVEAIAGWTENGQMTYMSSASAYAPDAMTPSNVIPDLGHMEQNILQVVTDGNYLGSFRVINGQITLIDAGGLPINFNVVTCGLLHRSFMQSLPLGLADPGMMSRKINTSVRVRGSTRPIINGERPSDRTPATIMDRSESIFLVDDLMVAHMGSDIYQFITVEEYLPYRTEVLGIYSSTAANSVS